MSSVSPITALRKRAVALQQAEFERQRDLGAETIDHEVGDERVLEALRDEGTWEAVALAAIIGRARGDARNAQGPQVKEAHGQLGLLRTRDTLLMLNEEESQYLGVLVDKKDAARLNAAITTYDHESRDALRAATVATTKTSGLREVLDDILNDRTVAWDDEEEDESPGAIAA